MTPTSPGAECMMHVREEEMNFQADAHSIVYELKTRRPFRNLCEDKYARNGAFLMKAINRMNSTSPNGF